jgi:hypothetical protein
MKKNLLLGILASALLVVMGCTVSLPEGDSGSILLTPFVDEEIGIQGVAPQQGWTDQAELIQYSLPGSIDDAIALVLDQTSLTELPEPVGSYKGKALTWDLYTFETQSKDVGPQTLHADLALAEDESAAYLVALAVLPDAYDASSALYETVFTHMVYALAPFKSR